MNDAGPHGARPAIMKTSPGFFPLAVGLMVLAVASSIIPMRAGGNMPRNHPFVPQMHNVNRAEEKLPVPVGNAPVIDGTITNEEWQGARRESFSDGSELLLLRFGDELYLGIRARAQDMIAGNIFISRGDGITIHHASAALGTAVYQKDGKDWRLVRDFSWRCRRSDDGEEARAERSAFFLEENWIASNSRMGAPHELEYRIRIPYGPLRLAAVFLRAPDPATKVPWPASLDDDCVKSTSGGLPPAAAFSPDKWGTVTIGKAGPREGAPRRGTRTDFFALPFFNGYDILAEPEAGS